MFPRLVLTNALPIIHIAAAVSVIATWTLVIYYIRDVVFAFVCLSVCLSVWLAVQSITHKVVDEF